VDSLFQFLSSSLKMNDGYWERVHRQRTKRISLGQKFTMGDKPQQDQLQKILGELLAQPDNKHCADCGAKGEASSGEN
jgi:hypothetical protein